MASLIKSLYEQRSIAVTKLNYARTLGPLWRDLVAARESRVAFYDSLIDEFVING